MSRWPSQSLAHACAVLQGAPPVFVIDKPLHGALQPLVQSDGGAPAQLGAHEGRVDSIAGVVAGSIFHERDLVGVQGWSRPLFVEDRAYNAHEVDVAHLILSTDVVGPPWRAARQH